MLEPSEAKNKMLSENAKKTASSKSFVQVKVHDWKLPYKLFGARIQQAYTKNKTNKIK